MLKTLPKLQQRYDKTIKKEKIVLIELRKIRENKKNLAWKLNQIKNYPANYL